MLKFVAGAVTGWVSARALPPPQEPSQRLQPPTYDEVYVLARKAKDAVERVLEKIELSR